MQLYPDVDLHRNILKHVSFSFTDHLLIRKFADLFSYDIDMFEFEIDEKDDDSGFESDEEDMTNM
jgi:hypothetical protein